MLYPNHLNVATENNSITGKLSLCPDMPRNHFYVPLSPQKPHAHVISLLLVCFSLLHCSPALALSRHKAECTTHFFEALEHEPFFTLDSLCPVFLGNFSQHGDQPVLQSALQPPQQCCSIDQPGLLQDPDGFMPPACHFPLPLTTQPVEIPRLFAGCCV